MKKIASLMLLLLSPFCARAMDAKSALSPRTQCLTNCGTPLVEMVRHEMSLIPDAQQITEANRLIDAAQKASTLKALERSLVPKATGNEIELSDWQKAQILLSNETKVFFLRQIIQEARESKK